MITDKKPPLSLDESLYVEMREKARRMLGGERREHTLQPTALVHEAFLRYMKPDQMGKSPDPKMFKVAAARAMRRILVEHARGRQRVKRQHRRQPLEGNEMARADSSDEFLAVDEALKKLAKVDERQSQIVEMHFFGGFKFQEIAEHFGVSLSTVEKEFRQARTYLAKTLTD